MMDNIEKSKNIPSTGPSITQQEIDLVTEAITYGWYDNMNKYINQFTLEFSDFIDKKYCLPTSHGTDAIHLALLSLDIGKGDEVIVPDITWVASASPIVCVGATPVLVDINKDNWCLCPKAFENAITKKTKAVIVVSLFGNMPDMDKILAVAKKHNIYVIEDAAEGIGSTYRNKLAGSMGDIGIFSFNATKLIIAGQGGILVTNNKEIYNRCKLFAHHGIDKYPGAKYYWSNLIGYNYNWSNIQAALALAQLRRINELIDKKKKIFAWYNQQLSNISDITLNYQEKNSCIVYWISVAIIGASYQKSKEYMVAEFKKFNIDVRPFFYPISSMPPYRKYNQAKDMSAINPNVYHLSPYGICLPSGHNLTKQDISYVCQCFKKIINQ